MKIVVCVKQVPGTTQVEIDPITGTLKRDGVESKMNPYDLFALEAAFQLVEKKAGSVVSITMGPPQAASTLRETVYMGADHSYLLSDRKFAGADVQATSYAIASGVKKIGSYDLIICGKQTTDGDTAQVGPEMAEMLGIEHVTNVLTIDDVDDTSVTVTFDLDGILQTQKMSLPCLLTIDKDAYTPRLPSYRRKKAIGEDCVTVWSSAELEGVDENRLGLKGSPTQVERIFPPTKNQNRSKHEGSNELLADLLDSYLHENKYL